MELRTVKFRVIETEAQLRYVIAEHMEDKLWQEHFVFETSFGLQLAEIKIEYSKILGENRYFLHDYMTYDIDNLIQRALEYGMVREGN